MYKLVLKFVLLVTAVIILPNNLTLKAQNSSWTSNGPDGGHISCLSISPSDPDILYAGTVNGVYKTENGGDLWFKTNFPDFYEVRSIRVFPSDPQIVFVGTIDCGAYRTADGGKSWKYMGLWEYTITTLDIDPTNEDILFIGSGESNQATGAFIFKAHNKWLDGSTLIFWNDWEECGWKKVNKILVDPDSSNIIYAAGINSGYCPTYGGILISRDSGATWTDKQIGTTNYDEASNIAIVKNSLDQKTLFAIYGGSPLSTTTKLMKSPDMGDTWEEVEIPYTGKINPNVLLTDPKNQGSIIIGSYNAEKPLWLYTNETGKWDFIPGNGLPPAISPTCTELNPGDAFSCYLATLYGGIHRYSDSKGNWEKINSGINNSMVNDFVVDPGDKTIYAATTEELKLSKSTDKGSSWAIQPSNFSASFDILTIDPNHPSTFWAAKSSLSYYRLFKAENHGQLWTGPIGFLDGPAIGNYTEISDILVKPGDSNTILISTQPYFLSSGLTGFGAIAYTIDGGSHWGGFSVPGSCLAVDPSDTDMFYIGKERSGQVYLMEVDGASTSLSSIDPEEDMEDVQDILLDNQSNLFVATEAGLWKKSGMEWKTLDCPAENIIALAMDHRQTPSMVFAGSESDGIFVSENSGDSWIPFNNGLANLNIRKLKICDDMIYASSEYGGLWSREIPESISQQFLTHNTGNMGVSVFQNGSVGHAAPNWSYGDGLVFQNNLDPLFNGGLLLGTSERGSVNGQLGVFDINSDFQNTGPISGFESIAGKFDQVAKCSFNDNSSSKPLGIDVDQRSYSNSGENLVILRYNMKSSSGSIEGLYTGLFADWDVGVDLHDQNLGGIDMERNLAYQYLDGGAPDPNYYGIVALDGISGTRITGKGHSMYIRDSSFRWISTINNEEITEADEYRMWIGSGPFQIPEGESLQVCFAIVAGSNLTELQSNADLAAEKYLDLEELTGVEQDAPAGFLLEQNIPNPFSLATEIHYSLPYPCDILIEVFNTQGNKVKIYQHKGQLAGRHSMLLNSEELEPGIYYYSMKAGSFFQTKMMVRY